jgi:DNA-binding NarL/FixJ family response regulator
MLQQGIVAVAQRRVLVVEDEAPISAVLGRLLKTVAVARTSETAKSAVAMLQREHFAAAVIDPGLPDGDGLEVVERAKDLAPQMPVLILTGKDDAMLANRALELRAAFARKLDLFAAVQCFMREVLLWENIPDESATRERFAEFARRRKYSGRQLLVLLCHRRGLTRAQTTDALGTSESTIKGEVAEMLRMDGASNLDDLLWIVEKKPPGS